MSHLVPLCKGGPLPRTTNPLEAEVFSQLKNKINIHAGMGKSLKLKMVDEFLLNYKKK